MEDGSKPAVVIEFGTPNKNGHVYTKAAVQEAVDKLQERLDSGTMLATMSSGSPTDSPFNINLDAVSHKIEALNIEGNKLVAMVKTLQTPMGKLAQQFDMENIDYEFVPCGHAKVAVDGTISDMTITHFSMIAKKER